MWRISGTNFGTTQLCSPWTNTFSTFGAVSYGPEVRRLKYGRVVISILVLVRLDFRTSCHSNPTKMVCRVHVLGHRGQKTQLRLIGHFNLLRPCAIDCCVTVAKSSGFSLARSRYFAKFSDKHPCAEIVWYPVNVAQESGQTFENISVNAFTSRLYRQQNPAVYCLTKISFEFLKTGTADSSIRHHRTRAVLPFKLEKS